MSARHILLILGLVGGGLLAYAFIGFLRGNNLARVYSDLDIMRLQAYGRKD